MATYTGNAYELLSIVRQQLNDYSAALVNGTDTSGAFSNAFLLDQINNAQREIYAILMRIIPEEFLTNTTIVGSSSVFSLPWDFGKVVEFRDSDGYPVYPAKTRNLPINSQLSGASKNTYYRKGQTLVVFRSNVSDTYKLWYYSKPREIHAGKASAGAATSITLDASYAKLIADYYNGMGIENVTDDSVDTISDYTAARVATIAGTGEADDYYGIVSELPEPFHNLIGTRAALLAAQRSHAAEMKPTIVDWRNWDNTLNDVLLAFGIGEDQQRPEDLWTEYGGGYDEGGIDIPGQGYLIY